MAYRKTMRKGANKKNFKNSASRFHKKNLTKKSGRGGYRF